MELHGKTTSGLVVTVRNGERQCYIMRNDNNQSFTGSERYSKSHIESESPANSHCDSSVQVTDGRYASTYKVTHCHVSPTSPSEEISEFPLQRKPLNSGDSHFEIGGDRGSYPRSYGALRKVSPERGNMARLNCPDEFLRSLRKYSNFSANRRFEIVETSNSEKNTATKEALSPTKNIREELLTSAKRDTHCDNSSRQGDPQICEISKWFRQDRDKLMMKPNTTSINARDQSLHRKNKGSLRSVTLPNIASSVNPSILIQSETQTNIESPQLYNNYIMPKLQEAKSVQATEEEVIKTEIVTDLNKVTYLKSYLEISKSHNINNCKIKTNDFLDTSNKKEHDILNTNITNYKLYSVNDNIQSDSNDEFLKDAILRWLHVVLIKTGRCTEPPELNFIFQYLYKHLKILKKYNYLLSNSKSECNIKNNIRINNDGITSEMLSDDDDIMMMTIDRLTDLLMAKIRLIYNKEVTSHIELVNRNLKIKEILPKLDDDFNIGSDIYKDVNFQKYSSKEDQPYNSEEKVIKDFDDLTKIKKAIGDWMDLLDLPEQPNKNMAINILASDIKKRIDRQNYIQSRSASYIISDEVELEYFRYLIFMWHNKYFYKEQIEKFGNVKTLFDYIKNINPKYNSIDNCFDWRNQVNVIAYPVLMHDIIYNDNKNLKDQETHLTKGTTTLITSGNKVNKKIQCLQLLTKYVENITITHDPYEEYEQFVRKWCQEITLDVFTSCEADVAEKATFGIYNGIWKAIIKLNYMEYYNYYDHFHYEDNLEKEIDDLIDCLPQTPQLITKRHTLKVRFIEKTITTMEKICKNRQMSLKNQLILNILEFLKTLKLINFDNLKNMQPCLFCVAEMFILWKTYLNKNQEIAKIYEKKMSKEIENLYFILKRKCKIEPNSETFHKNVMDKLHQINISEHVLLEEADKVFLGLEIDQWFVDLLIISKNIFEDENHKRMMKNILIALIMDTDNNINLDDNSKTSKLHSDIRQILENNILKEKKLNTVFLASELLNRIENIRHWYPTNTHLSGHSNINSLSFAEKITKYKLGLHETENIDLTIWDCQARDKPDGTLRQTPDTVENSILHAPSAHKGPRTSDTHKNNIKWHTLTETMVQSENSENSMKTAFDSEVPFSNSYCQVKQLTLEQEEISKKCCCKRSTTNFTNQFNLHDEEKRLSVTNINNSPKMLKPCGRCDYNTPKNSENNTRDSVRECQTDAYLNLNNDFRKFAFCNKKENSKDIGIDALVNNRSMCSCTVGTREPSSSSSPDSIERCHCIHRCLNYNNELHSQADDEHTPSIPVLYPYLYFN